MKESVAVLGTISEDAGGIVLSDVLGPAPVAPAPEREFDVAIVGLGYVGLPTALAYRRAGTRVLGFDISAPRLEAIRAGRADLLPSDRDSLAEALRHPGFELTADPARLQSAAAIVVCVPTPVDRALAPELGILRSACELVVSLAAPGQLVVLTSTTYVGCTRDFLVRPLQERGLRIGSDVFVAFSAERIDPGNDAVEQERVPRVVGGATAECAEEAFALLSRYAASVHPVQSLEAAEMTKLLENTFRAVNIALANEFADICVELGLDVTEVIDAAATKPYGFMRFVPGPGVGGHCIPCDPHYLLWQLRRRRMTAPLITQAMALIADRPRHVVERARELLAERGIGLGGARILVVGVSYKPDVADLRESPAIEILLSLRERGSVVRFVDPHFEQVALPNGVVMDAVEHPERFAADLVLLHTRHRDLDLAWIPEGTIVLDATYRSRDVVDRVLL